MNAAGEAMMFLGDHWIGTEPFMDEFKTIGLDAVVGSVGNGATLRLISDIEGGEIYGRPPSALFLPGYLPMREAILLRKQRDELGNGKTCDSEKPIDRIGYGGYLKLANEFPGFCGLRGIRMCGIQGALR